MALFVKLHIKADVLGRGLAAASAISVLTVSGEAPEWDPFPFLGVTTGVIQRKAPDGSLKDGSNLLQREGRKNAF